MNIRVLPTAGLSDSDRIALRRLFDAAYDGDFTDDDFDHALGGWHAIAGDLAAPIAHAAVVARCLFIDTRELRTGFVEAVATLPAHQRTGLGSRVMAAITGEDQAASESATEGPPKKHQSPSKLQKPLTEARWEIIVFMDNNDGPFQTLELLSTSSVKSTIRRSCSSSSSQLSHQSLILAKPQSFENRR